MKQCLFCSALLIGIVSVLVPIVTSYFVCQMAMRSQMYKAMSNTTIAKGLVQPNAYNEEVAGGFFKRLAYLRDPMVELNYRFEDVEFPSNDEPHLKLRGWFIPALNHCDHANVATIVMLHGAFIDRREMTQHASYLAKHGYNCLLFDARDHGLSDSFERRGVSLGIRESRDISAAIDYLQNERKMSRFAVFGVSNGAASAILAAGNDSRIEAIVAENPFSSRKVQLEDALINILQRGNWGAEKLDSSLVGRFLGVVKKFVPEWFYSFAPWFCDCFVLNKSVPSYGCHAEPIDTIDTIEAPIFLSHGDADNLVLLKHSQALYDRGNKAKIEFVVVPGGQHSRLMNQFGNKYTDRIVNFLEKHFPFACKQ